MEEKHKFYLTKQGFEKIKQEFDALQKQRSIKVEGETPKFWQSEELNPEYLSFREDLSFIETKIEELGNVLKNSEIIHLPPKSQRSLVNLGATITVDLDGQLDEFTIVGSFESDPLQNKISNESPIGQALLEKKVGDIVNVNSTLVSHNCKILKIKYEL
jgi:transcription elongation factor GreA